jgi:uncharacterized protein (DUF934 family)
MSLYRDGHFIEDDWLRLGEEDPIPADGKIVLSRTRLLADVQALRGRNTPFGLVLASGETLDGLEDIIPHLSLVVLDIPRYGDGRLYSAARLLRERHGYRGEIRAAGDVLRDQIMFLHRVGVDSFSVSHPGTIEALRSGAIVAVRDHYQAAARDTEESHPGARDGDRPWRRVSPAGAVPGVRA